jgi:FHA domain-containing protein
MDRSTARLARPAIAMAKLVLSSGGSILYQCFLDKERVKVGREPRNQVVIDDPGVDAEHAVVVTVGNDHIIEDLQSVNGTFVNGTRVFRHIFQHGDVVQFGAFFLRYMNPKASGEMDLDRTMLITGLHGDIPPSEAGLSPQEARVPAARVVNVRFPKGRVRVVAGERAGDMIELDSVVTTIGRADDRLAVIARRPHGFFISHVEGRHYARVNGQSIGKEARLLRQSDIIEVADQRLEFLLD